MICAGVSDILYPGGTLGENSCIVCTRLPLLYAPAVTLHSMRIMFTFMVLIGSSDSCHRPGSNIRFVEKPSSDPMLLRFVKSTANEQYSSLFMVLLLGRNTIGYTSFSPLLVSSSFLGYRSCNRCLQYLAMASSS